MVTGVLAADIDHTIVRSLNRWFAASAGRVDFAKALAIVPLYVIVGLAALAWLADWGRDVDRRALLVIGVGGVALALLGNQILGHFYYRPRPFVAMQNVQLLIPHSKETSMYSDHLAVAGGLTAGILATRRWWFGALAVLASLAIAIGRIGAAVHYPSDVLVGAAAGAVGFLLLVPVRRVLRPPIRLVARVEKRIIPRGS